MLALAGSTGLALVAAHDPRLTAVVFGAFGATYIALTGLLLVWGIRLYPWHPAAGVGLAFLMIVAGQALGSPVNGVLIDTLGSWSAFGSAAALALGGALLAPRPNVGYGRDLKSD